MRRFDTPRGHIEVYATAAEVADALAARVIETARTTLERPGARFSLVLAGGSTPKAAYALLAQRAAEVEWSRVVVLFGDERCVPPESADSNFKMAHDALLHAVPAEVHRIEGERDPAEAARLYEETLVRVLGPAPRPDLVLLGLGPDGHTASLFPGTPALDERRALAVAVAAPTHIGPHVPRVTLTWPVLSGARQVVIAAVGAEKSPALGRALAPAGDPKQTPVRLVRPSEDALYWLVDEAAAVGAPR